MKELDLRTLTDLQYKSLRSYINDLLYHALDDDDTRNEYQRIDLALMQQFQEPPTLTKPEDGDVEVDEFSELFTPLTLKTRKGWVVHLKEACIPRSGDWFSVDRRYSSFFDNLGLMDFLPTVNDCVVRNIEVENETFKITPEIRKGLTQFGTYGHTPGLVYYDADRAFSNLKVVHARDYGIYPISDDWQKSNNVIRYSMNYTDLLAREDLDQELIDYIRPETGLSAEDYNEFATPTERSSYYEDERAPFGKVMLHDIWIPSLYIEGDGQNPEFVAGGAFLTIAYNPQIKPNRNLTDILPEGQQVMVLKALYDVKPEDLTILFAAFDEVLPGQLKGRGPLAPFLVFQELQNTLIQGMAREVARETDPPLQVESGEIDIEEADLPDYKHGALYKGVNITAMHVQGYENRLQSYQIWDKHINNLVEEGSGMAKIQLGARPQSKRTKFEIQEQLDAGSLRINDAADLFDEGFLKPFLVAREKQRIYQLRLQIENSVTYLMRSDPTLTIDMAYEIALRANKLFNRLLNSTAIAPKYKEFYRNYQKRLDENNSLIEEFQTDLIKLSQAQEQLAKPIPEFVPPQGGQFDPASVKNAEEEYYSFKQQEKQQLEQVVDVLTQKVKTTQHLIEDIGPIPAPSNKLYYEMLAHDIDESDIIISGTKSSLNKTLAKNAIREMFELAKGLDPESIKELDFKKIFKEYANTVGLSYENMRKSEVEINRLEEQLRQQLQAQQLAATNVNQ